MALNTGQDILRHILRRAGEILPTDTAEGSADHLIDAKEYINSAYFDICALKPWRWGRKRKEFSSIAQTTRTVTILADTTVTLADPIVTSVAGQKFIINSDSIPHRIASHTAGSTTLVLESTYTGTSTSGSCTVFQDEILVATDILAYPVIRQISYWTDVRLVSEKELNSEFGNNLYGLAGRQRYAAFISDSTIKIAPWTQEATLFEVSYNYRPTALDFTGGAGDTPIVPTDSRIAIAQRALSRIYSDKRDGRLEVVNKELDETLHRMSSTESTFNRPRMYIPIGHRVSG